MEYVFPMLMLLWVWVMVTMQILHTQRMDLIHAIGSRGMHTDFRDFDTVSRTGHWWRLLTFRNPWVLYSDRLRALVGK